MNARTALHRPSFFWPRIALRKAPPVQALPARRTDWLERLAVWAEKQPVHHHMGAWERLG